MDSKSEASGFQKLPDISHFAHLLSEEDRDTISIMTDVDRYERANRRLC